MAATKPLMLKDFLELDDANSESSNGFQCIPRKRSATALAKITAVVNAVKNGRTSTPSRSFLPRSLSRRLLGRRFWRRAAKEGAEAPTAVRVKDIVRLNSFEMYSQRSTLYFPSPAPSSRSSLCASDEGMCLESEEFLDAAADAEFSCNQYQEAKEESTNEESECRDCHTEEEKEQLSPVSVMNFPFQEEADDCNGNDEATSPCFEQSLANIERTKHQLLQKIRRFENLVELDPVDLLESFTNFKDYISSEDYEEQEIEEEDEEEEVKGSSLIRRLRSVGPHKDLLVDFFDEELIWTDDVEELLISAKKWIEGEEILTPGDHGEEQIKDIERNGRWRNFEDDKEELVADMEIRMLGLLIEELVLDLVS